MGSTPEEAVTARRLTELRRASAADATLQNLLTALGTKLDLCSRLPIFEYEASSEGHDESANVFRQLAEYERSSFSTLAECLKHHLEDALTPAGAAGQEMNR